MTSGYSSDEERAKDAFYVINDLMGELHACRMIFFLASDKFMNSPKVTDLKERMGDATLVYVRRIALLGFASVMFKYRETYEKFLKPLGCVTDKSKALLRKILDFEQLRHIGEHVIDKDTGRHHSTESLIQAFEDLNKAFKSPLEEDSNELMIRLEECRNEIEAKFPTSKTSVQERHKKHEAAEEKPKQSS